jgi:hypothetical protein
MRLRIGAGKIRAAVATATGVLISVVIAASPAASRGRSPCPTWMCGRGSRRLHAALHEARPVRSLPPGLQRLSGRHPRRTRQAVNELRRRTDHADYGRIFSMGHPSTTEFATLGWPNDVMRSRAGCVRDAPLRVCRERALTSSRLHPAIFHHLVKPPIGSDSTHDPAHEAFGTGGHPGPPTPSVTHRQRNPVRIRIEAGLDDCPERGVRVTVVATYDIFGGAVALIDRRKKKHRGAILVFCPSGLLLVTGKWLASQFLSFWSRISSQAFSDELPGIVGACMLTLSCASCTPLYPNARQTATRGR